MNRTRYGWEKRCGIYYILLHHTGSSAYCGHDKVIADVVEAILAAAFLSGGHELALQAARQLQVPIPNVAQWSDYARLAAQHAAQAQATQMYPAPPSTTVAVIEMIFGAKFNRPELLGQALVSRPLLYYARLEQALMKRLDPHLCLLRWARHELR